MYDKSVALIEMAEHDSISVCVYIEQDGIFEFGERLNKQFEEAYMNGYNWDALISYYIKKENLTLSAMVNTDPEAGMFSAYMSYTPENLEIMKQYEKYIRTMLSDEESLINFIKENYENIEWD